MKCIGNLFRLTAVAVCGTVFLTGCSLFKTEDVVVGYETENYNQNIYQDSLFASELCVADGDVSMDGAPDTSGLHAAALFDVNGAKVDFAYQMYDRLYPASTTKIMTALLAIEYGDLSQKVTVSEAASSTSFAADESVCEIKTGDVLTLKDLLYGLLMCSGNDAAVAIAETVSGSVDEFVDLMNERAQELMATQTHFENPHGLHSENHYTTAYDLYLIFNECIKHDEFLEVISADSYTPDITDADGNPRNLEWEPTNFYATGEADPPQNATLVGGKTGTTQLAGNCLVLLEKDSDDQPFISIVMGADTKDLLYQDMTMLIENIPENTDS
nr:D-alanyl-D-alanine carboxypeptidase [uncultured Merdimonas sp.]